LLVAQRAHNGTTSQQELSATVWTDTPTSILPMSGTICEPVLSRDSAEEEFPSTVDSWFYQTWVAPSPRLNQGTGATCILRISANIRHEPRNKKLPEVQGNNGINLNLPYAGTAGSGFSQSGLPF
jgi:hypothetical protein